MKNKNHFLITFICFILTILFLASCKDTGDDSEDGQPPGIPTGLSVIQGYNELTIKYDSISGINNYNIYMDTNSGITINSFMEKHSVGQNQYTWTGLTNGTTYYFIVTAENDYGESSASSLVSGTPSETGFIPDAPADLCASPGIEQVTLYFGIVSGAVSYNIYMSTSADVSKTNYLEKKNTTFTEFTWMKLPKVVYYFVVSAVNSYGESELSNETSVFALCTEKRIIATDPEDDDYFGNRVSISGDYAIVGASQEDGAGIDQGAAYIFHRTGINSWDSVVKIIATDPEDFDCFGISVSISGDYVIVGAYNEDGEGVNWGAAYIFYRTWTNSWDSGVKITATDPGDSDKFGCSVSISGDYAIVGASKEDGAGTDRGAAYIFHKTGTNSWDSVVKIIASVPEDEDYFGISVSISGDYAIVGAYKEDGAGTDRGAAYTY
jgi:hypothetical protein